jgi:hypothetical protein
VIPTIEDIVRGVKDGSIGFNQACNWLEEHVKLAREAGGADAEERRYFAAMAMQGLLANPDHSELVHGHTNRAEVALASADALLKALSVQREGSGQ